jgi:C-terminal processing protease CtpA/Prc
MMDHDEGGPPPQPAGEPIDAEERSEVVFSIGRLLNEKYIFPEVAQKMAERMENDLNEHRYDSITDTHWFAQRLTDDLRSISGDKHLKVKFDPNEVQLMRELTIKQVKDEIPEDLLKKMQFDNFGFKEIKILLGNIGYIDLRAFGKASIAGETAVAAMNFVANCSALIFDLRNNSGGCPSMIQLLTSYLYDGREAKHLNSFYWRHKDEMVQFWTLPHVPGKRMPQVDVYILTSRHTFSAAEGFTYNLQNLKRATIVGETTGGGAHPVFSEVATDRFSVWVPKGRAINPITKTNWEGTGVEPDIKVDKEKALETAHVKALESLMAKNMDPVLKPLYDRHLETLQKKLKDEGICNERA